MMKKKFWTLIFLLNSCALYQKPEVPNLESPSAFKDAVQVTDKNLKETWWENFNDSQLNHFVTLALKNNYNYQVALKNIEIAETYVTQNISNYFPQVNLNANSSRNQSSPAQFQSATSEFQNTPIGFPTSSGPYNLQQASLQASYQVDIWNQIGNSVSQARADVSVSEANSKSVKLILISSVTNTYFQIAALNSNLDNLNQQKKSVQGLLDISNTRFKSGLIDAVVIDDLKNQLLGVENTISLSEKQRQFFINTLAYLIGEYPENAKIKLDKKFPTMAYEKLIPPEIPAKMIADRPDVQNSYFQILSYGYMEKQNIANFLPSISLTGAYGYASPTLVNFISNSNTFWSFGLNIMQYVFDYQTRMSIYKRSKLQYENAISTYKNTVINAYKEVDNSLIAYKKDSEIFRAHQHQCENSKDKLNIASAQYNAGLYDYSTYLNDNVTFLQNDYNLTNQKLAVTSDVVQVYNSLGLGSGSK